MCKVGIMEKSVLDRRLWVVLFDDTKGILVGNPHTYPGRFNVWSMQDNEAITCSLEDIREASPEARLWLEGYLAGNEPSPYLFFGDRAEELADDSVEMTD